MITINWKAQRIQELEIMLKNYLQFLTLTTSTLITDSVYNILTMKVLPATESTRILDSIKIGQERYEQFFNQNVEADSSIWDTLKKLMLPTFVNNNKTIKIKVNSMDVQVFKSLPGLLTDSLNCPDCKINT